MSDFTEKIRDFINENHLRCKGERIVAAVSGGADSVCLLLVLQELSYEVVAAHCNFHLRGDESNRDERFVAALCGKLGIRLHTAHFNTNDYAREHGISIEMAAREQRYGFFRQLMQEEHCGKTAIAHHADDNVETLFINLLRGTGINGLCGIRPQNGPFVRPLLCCRRSEIITYLKERGQDYVTDSTNLVADVVRNRIRLEVMPLLESITPAATDSILTTIDNLNEARKVYDHAIQNADDNITGKKEDLITIDKDLLLSQPSPITILHHLLAPLGFNRSQLLQILQSLNHTGSQFETTSTNALPIRLTIDRQLLYIETIENEPFPPTPIDLSQSEGIISLPHGQLLTYKVKDFTPGIIRREKEFACIDLAKVDKELIIRPVKTGDSFIPFGMHGRKLVSDFLTDEKVPLPLKARQLVVETGGRIAWVAGKRLSEEFRTDKNTKRVVILEFHKSPTL